MSYVLGLDLGTSSLKALLVNEEGEVIASESSQYESFSDETGFSEQNPSDWLDACDRIFSKLNQKADDFQSKLEGISFSGQMHSLVLLDEQGQVLRPAILWNDVRTTKQCEEIMEKAGTELLSITKNRAIEGFTLPKILWVMENEPEIWRKAAHILLPKDYLRWYLTGELAMDYSDASGTLLLDVKEQKWSETLLDIFDIPLEKLPALVNAFDLTGDVREEIKGKYQLENKVSVFAGAADNACAAIGSGLNSTDTALVSIGTSGVFLTIEPDIDADYKGKLHFFNHANPNEYYSMGVTLSAGASLTWFKNTFAPNQTFEALFSLIKQVPPGSEGLVFTPYLQGERTPYFDSSVRGSFVGIDSHHSLPNFVRAVVEGITFSLKDSQELMETVGQKNFQTIISVGGGARNKEWLQIQADVFDTPVVSLTSEQGPSLGAAIIAAMGLSWFPSLEKCIEIFVEFSERVYPNKRNVSTYQTVYEKYKKIYPDNTDFFH
ncbi:MULTISPECIES: xylulokinase [unclassified Enterococcus]|uniref:xylulokinase n=1 Tax=unclassified Enterococcus TaxID=2608891 RepID=UPI0013EB4741|nr:MULTISPECIES: xylulokinase [unclassified Enterococcus]